MKKFLLSYWGIVAVCVAICVIVLSIFKPDLGEPQTKTLQYDAKWDRFYFMENDKAVPVFELTSNNNLIEGMQIDIYDYWCCTCYYPHGTSIDIVKQDAFFYTFILCFLSCLLILVAALLIWAMRIFGKNDNQKKEKPQ